MINDGTLVSSQILTIGAINAALVFGLLTLYRFYGEAPLFLRGVWWHGLLARLAMALLAGGFAMLASITAYDYGKTTLLVVNAGLLTLWYLELAMILASGSFLTCLMVTCLLRLHFLSPLCWRSMAVILRLCSLRRFSAPAGSEPHDVKG